MRLFHIENQHYQVSGFNSYEPSKQSKPRHLHHHCRVQREGGNDFKDFIIAVNMRHIVLLWSLDIKTCGNHDDDDDDDDNDE